MKHYTCIILLTGILLAGFSCDKEEMELSGKVLDVHTKVPIPERTIMVQAMIKSGKKVIPVNNGAFSTDRSGCFKYAMKKIENAYSYRFCIVGDSAYAYSNVEMDLTELKRYGRFLSLTLNKLTDITISIDRKNTLSDNEILYVSWESDGQDGRYLYPYEIKDYNEISSSDPDLIWIGGNIHSEIKTKVLANKETIVQWNVFRDGKMKVFRDTIFCSMDTSNCILIK